MINTVTFAGNLTRDAEVRQTQSGTTTIKFSVAINNRRKNQQTGMHEDDPIFVECTFFDNRGSFQWMVPYLTKGFHVVVSGNLHMSKWEDKQTGQPRSRIDVIARDIDANWPKKQQAPQTASYAQTPQAYQMQHPQMQPQMQQPQMQPQMQQPMQQQTDVYDDNIPF